MRFFLLLLIVLSSPVCSAMAADQSADAAAMSLGIIDSMVEAAKRVASNAHDVRVYLAAPIAFLFLVGGLIGVFKNASSNKEILQGIVTMTLVAGVASLSPFFMNLAEDAGDASGEVVSKVSRMHYKSLPRAFAISR